MRDQSVESSGVAKWEPGVGTCSPKKFLCPPQMISVLCIKMHKKIFLKYYAADKPNGMNLCDCIRIHALHRCVINNVIIQSTAFPQPRSQGLISTLVAR